MDDGGVELIDYLEQLKYAVAGRASAQRNVMFEYQNEAFESFLDTEKAVKCNIIRNILLSDVKIGKDGRLKVIASDGEGLSDGAFIVHGGNVECIPVARATA